MTSLGHTDPYRFPSIFKHVSFIEEASDIFGRRYERQLCVQHQLCATVCWTQHSGFDYMQHTNMLTVLM